MVLGLILRIDNFYVSLLRYAFLHSCETSPFSLWPPLRYSLYPHHPHLGPSSFNPQSYPTRADDPDVLQKRTTNHALKAHTVAYLRNHTKSFEYTRKVLKDIYGQTEDEVKRLGGNKMLEAILHKLGVPEAEEEAVGGE